MIREDASHDAHLQIPLDHPALAGHFPGNPLVPGVVLLDCVLTDAEHWLGEPLSAKVLTQAKFTAPLLPGQAANLQLKLVGEELRFTLSRADRILAQGIFKLAPRTARA